MPNYLRRPPATPRCVLNEYRIEAVFAMDLENEAYVGQFGRVSRWPDGGG